MINQPTLRNPEAVGTIRELLKILAGHNESCDETFKNEQELDEQALMGRSHEAVKCSTQGDLIEAVPVQSSHCIAIGLGVS
jgi:hypothetical protein